MPASWGIIAFTTLFYGFYYFFLPVQASGILGLNVLFLNGSYWQILSTIFMHGSWAHLAMNMAVLFQFGSVLERFLGSLRFLAVYLIGGVLTSALSFIYIYFSFSASGEVINLVGASGAICVLLGILARLDKALAKGLVIALLLMSFAPLLMGVNVAWYAHIIGFAIGFCYANFCLLKGRG